MSQLGWIHFSETFRNRVHTVLEWMEEEGTVDELGIGIFRDGFADTFFPGISTIQTRAKYFFIVPYIIKDFLRKPKNKRKDLGKYLYDEEHDLMWYLAALYHFDRNSKSGVIGITKRPKQTIARRASSIYWNGLRHFRFIETDFSLPEFCIKIDRSQEQQLDRTISDLKKGLADDADIDGAGESAIKVSTYKPNWREGLDMPLAYEEANFFLQKIRDVSDHTLLGRIAATPSLQKKFLKTRDFSSFVRLVKDELGNKQLQMDLVLAHDLNEVVYGLHLVYSNEINLQFHHHEPFREEWEDWKAGLYDKLIDLQDLDAERIILHAPRAGLQAQNFLREIIYQVKSGNPDYDIMAAAVKKQEKQAKGRKSRFKPGVESDIQPGEVKSLAYFNYRYNNAKQIIADILKGLEQNA